MKPCAFCHLIAGQTPADIVHADDQIVIFLDKLPVAPGQLVVVPRQHAYGLNVLPPETAAALLQGAAKAGSALMRTMDADGYNLLFSQGTCAGQTHLHIALRVIPRRGDDDIVLPFLKTRDFASAEERQEAVEQLRLRLGGTAEVEEGSEESCDPADDET